MNARITMAKIIGTGFGSGYWPWGPGTAGALVATLIWGLLSLLLSPIILMTVTALLTVLFTFAGTWATRQLMPLWGNDPSRVVVDEMVGVWMPLLVVAPGEWWQAIAAFLLFRFFDILKPLGIRSLDRRTGAFWVMADDLLAGLYSLIILMAIECLV